MMKFGTAPGIADYHTHLCSYCATPYRCNDKECEEEDAELFDFCDDDCFAMSLLRKTIGSLKDEVLEGKIKDFLRRKDREEIHR